MKSEIISKIVKTSGVSAGELVLVHFWGEEAEMSEQKVSKLNRYFEEQISMCHRRNKELLADERTDEAVFEKVKANVYDIFRTILSVAVKTSKGDSDAVRRFFIQKTGQIPSSWVTAYDKAKQHDDVVKMRLEQIKLDTVDRIKENFAKIWEGAE